jgi:hypothetical protein
MAEFDPFQTVNNSFGMAESRHSPHRCLQFRSAWRREALSPSTRRPSDARGHIQIPSASFRQFAAILVLLFTISTAHNSA